MYACWACIGASGAAVSTSCHGCTCRAILLVSRYWPLGCHSPRWDPDSLCRSVYYALAACLCINILPQCPPALALQPRATLGVIMSNVVRACVCVCALVLTDAFTRPTPPRCGHDPPAEMLLLVRLLFRSTSAQVLLPCAPSLGRLREEIL